MKLQLRDSATFPPTRSEHAVHPAGDKRDTPQGCPGAADAAGTSESDGAECSRRVSVEPGGASANDKLGTAGAECSICGGTDGHDYYHCPSMAGYEGYAPTPAPAGREVGPVSGGNDCPVCNLVGGPLVRCTTCGLLKGPRGRAVAVEAANGYCGWDCPGYTQEPQADGLWPGERYGDSLGHMDWHTPAPVAGDTKEGAQ